VKGLILVTVLALSLAGCARIKQAGLPIPDATPPARYLPGQQYGDGGATPCMDGNCPRINQPRQWLKPCN